MPVLADTDGTEQQIAQPEKLEIQLGTEWAGVEFQLRTDAGIYPDTIVVSNDGILRMELGNSSNYILSCTQSSVKPPEPNTSLESNDETESYSIILPAQLPENENNETQQKTQREIAGIPIKHLILFTGGLILAIGTLIGIHILKKRKKIFS